jgi:hypothetical protein
MLGKPGCIAKSESMLGARVGVAGAETPGHEWHGLVFVSPASRAAPPRASRCSRPNLVPRVSQDLSSL